MQTLILTVIFVLLGAGTVAMVESALFSISLTRVKVLVEKKRRGAVSLLEVKENMRRPITVLVTFNNAINIIGSGIIGTMAAAVFGQFWVAPFSAFLTLLIIVCGEIIPKSLGELYAERISLLSARPLILLSKILLPLVMFIEWITKRLTKHEAVVTEDEIRMLSTLGHAAGTIEEDEKEMIQRIFRLNDLAARDIMTPRTIVAALNIEKTLGEEEDTICRLPHSRVPLFDNSLDSIVGVAFSRELLLALARGERERKIGEFRRETLFVKETVKTDKLLTMFQAHKHHLAIVVDEFGGTAGIVTLEDALEQLVGEIVDEKDRDVDTRVRARETRKHILDRAVNA